MKKLFVILSFFPFWGLVSLFAQSSVSIVPITANYAATPPTVTFEVSWPGGSRDADHHSKVWLLVDYRRIQDNAYTGGWLRAGISSAHTPTTNSGAVSLDPGNTKGFWLQGTDDLLPFAATVTVPVTVDLTGYASQFAWCGVASDYPPNVLANTAGSYTLAGTPPFTLIASSGTTTQTVNEKTIAIAAVTMTPATITDATGYPGLWCPYTGSDLYMDATHRCRERQSGAYNWEAWIKDTRDNELYRIVFMPDDQWWLAQNVRYASTGATGTDGTCSAAECGRCYTDSQYNGSYGGTSGKGSGIQGVCPPAWSLPVNSSWETLMAGLGNDIAEQAVALRHHSSSCGITADPYGFANTNTWCQNELEGSAWRTNTNGYIMMRVERNDWYSNPCAAWQLSVHTNTYIAVRCLRSL